MDLGIKISELNGKIVFSSAVRDRFKGKILNSFLMKIYGEEYRDQIWDMQEEYENKKYTEISSFFDLLEKKYKDEDTVFTGFTEEIKDRNMKNKEILETVDIEIYVEPEEINRKISDDLHSSRGNINLEPENKKQEKSASDIEDTLLKHSLKNEVNTEKVEVIIENGNTEKKIKNDIQKLSEKISQTPGLKKGTDKQAKNNSAVFSNAEFRKYEKLKREIEIKEERLLKLINETKTFLEEKKFYKAVQNVDILAKTDKSTVLNEEKIKYSLEGILLRVIRFFVQRNVNNREYWGYFTDKYDEKRKFYNNIVSLREYCGLRPNLENEEYEVKRRD